ncbi:hypothetical protein MKX01_018761 [Papaver californicum]|nr:hypothetical protein MKX01_018761 [Papaver californicum]
MDYLARLDFKISKVAEEKSGLTCKELETYLEETEEFAHLEFKKTLAEKLKSDFGVIKGLVLKDGEDCSICLQNLEVGDNALILKCSHTFHEKRMSEWLRTKPNCLLRKCERIKYEAHVFENCWRSNEL